MRIAKLATVVGVAAIGVAACGGSSSPSSSGNTLGLFDPSSFNTSNVSWLSANVNNTGSPPSSPTGTVILVGDGGNNSHPSAAWDWQGEYDTTGFEIARVASRQLVSYNASSDLTQSEALVPDIAQSLPTPTNNGLTYTFNLRTGSQAAMWNTSPPRPVTADDFIRGLKRNCDPDLAPNGNPGYYAATIQGFAAFCTPFENMPGGS
ncbi:MAG: hypothetical protein JOZ92_06265, partial [Candidatus Dormibacteraeota bacterium]|nr:hypothetical protein [Candidatus Dormibacteraeota bacterium]